MHHIMASIRYKRGLFHSHLKQGERERQTRKPRLRRRKRRRRNIWHEEACRIQRLITQRLQSVWFSCNKKKKGNTNGCDRTGLFSSQTAVQHQTERVCVRTGDTQLQRLTETDTLELLCQGDMGCQSQTSLSKPTLNLFLKGYIQPLAQ